jgi:hypothetical protein
MIASLFPNQESLSLEALLDRCSSGFAGSAEPFAPDAVAFCDALSKRMLAANLGSQWTALGFFFREAAVKKMRQELDGNVLRAPRGLVFHVTPGNVDTQFLYSWLLSVLAGNSNVVRVSSRLPEAAKDVCRMLAAIAPPRIRASSIIVDYAHDKAVTDALSARCDVRILWGGDASIEAIRQSPLRADAKEIAFPDRFSFAVVDVEGYLLQDDAGRSNVARGLQNDIFVFDQMACSSPKVLAWVGSPDRAHTARQDLWPRLAKQVDAAGIRVETMTALDKLHFAHAELADGKVTTAERFSNELFVLQSNDIGKLRSAHWGGGLVVDTVVADTDAALDLVAPSDQTLAHAGFTKDAVFEIARRARMKGLSRIVPIGRALVFSRHWDGMDLLSEMTRFLTVEA